MDPESLPVGFGKEGTLRARELQLLINIVVPDPRYQPYYLADEATLLDARDQQEETVRQRLEGYFGRPLRFPVIRQPLWKLVDDIKKLYPGWPDTWE
jgi:hypothetical protein